MGVRPTSRVDVMFNDNVPKVKGGHPVPVTNFMNAQCESTCNGTTPASECTALLTWMG